MKQIQKQLDRQQLTDTKIKLVIPKKILNQIKYLCKTISKVEWSGILFYSVKGTISDPTNMVLTIEDILPMHKGTSGYTEYTLDERVIEYMMENEESENWKIGHIHSHNSMGVFFSGTDWSELEDNAPNHNFYLSLIVNNYMDFCAKTCFIIESKESKDFNFYAKNEKGEKYIYTTRTFKTEEKTLVIYDNDIVSPQEDTFVENAFKLKVSDIIKSSEKTDVRQFNPNILNTPVYGRTWQERKKTQPGVFYGKDTSVKKEEKKETFNSWATEPNEEVFSIQDSILPKDREEDVENFAKFVINTGNDTTHFKNIEDILLYYKTFGLSGKALAKNIISKYPALYDQFFDSLEGREYPDIFIEITEEVIEEYELVLSYNEDRDHTKSLLEPVILTLTAMLDKFKQKQTK